LLNINQFDPNAIRNQAICFYYISPELASPHIENLILHEIFEVSVFQNI